MEPIQVLKPAVSKKLGADPSTPSMTTAEAALMAGGAAGLLVLAARGPLWLGILGGAGIAVVTKWGIDRSGA